MIVDSHCHLNFPDFKNDLETVLENAYKRGVKFFLTIATKLSEIKEIQELSERYPMIVSSVGVHPHEAENYYNEVLYKRLLDFANHPKVVGIGETGLDYYYDNSPRLQQIESFKCHIKASNETSLPLIIHTRSADDDTLTILDQYPNAKGVFHCFSGGIDFAKAALERGFYLSFSGIITFKNAELLREVVKITPLEKILLETDAPFLAPIPHRGKRNEPAFTYLVAEKIAEIKELPLELIKTVTTNNFFTLFSKASAYRLDS